MARRGRFPPSWRAGALRSGDCARQTRDRNNSLRIAWSPLAFAAAIRLCRGDAAVGHEVGGRERAARVRAGRVRAGRGSRPCGPRRSFWSRRGRHGERGCPGRSLGACSSAGSRATTCWPERSTCWPERSPCRSGCGSGFRTRRHVVPVHTWSPGNSPRVKAAPWPWHNGMALAQCGGRWHWRPRPAFPAPPAGVPSVRGGATGAVPQERCHRKRRAAAQEA